MSLLPVAEAQARLLALARPAPIETVPLASAAGRWTAEPVVALRTQPFADLSAMDGYAIRFAERPGPWTVASESSAGGPLPPALATGECARIFTGAPVPEGADTILIQEEATRDGAILRMTGEGPPHQGAHIRRRGFDFGEGDALMPIGTLLTPARIGLAAAAGHGTLAVRRRIRVALVSTGNELVPPGARTPAAMLPSSNAAMLAAMLARLPVDLDDLGIVPDDRTALATAFARAAATADLLVTIGGASVGDHDLVKPALADAGAAIDFWRVAMKPGKPLLAGTLGQALVLGLPGNPVSAFVTAHLFLQPLIAALGGSNDPLPRTRAATLAADLPGTGIRAEYLRAAIVDGRLQPLPVQDSAGLSALAAADALIVRPMHSGPAHAWNLTEMLDIA